MKMCSARHERHKYDRHKIAFKCSISNKPDELITAERRDHLSLGELRYETVVHYHNLHATVVSSKIVFIENDVRLI